MNRLFVLVLVWLFAGWVNAETIENIWLLKTGGIWEQNNQYGYYQAHVVRSGLEHVTDKLFVLELLADEKKNTKSIARRYEIPSPGIKAHVHDINFQMLDKQRMLLYVELEMKAMDNAVLREVYLLSPGGKYQLITEAKYKDISSE
ncbi:MAG: hypothetical protein OEZ43_06550 [Gammaproteobacteria bacterium]|nr:hypothetical protein [Gammaproteobacteria bacterium]